MDRTHPPVVGGLCVIQAKRYSKIVGLEAVHALAGVMEDKHAAKGVLVTTSWVGKASRDFAARNGRIEIIEGRQLKSMLLDTSASTPSSACPPCHLTGRDTTSPNRSAFPEPEARCRRADTSW